MLYPRMRNESLFDDFFNFDFPVFPDFAEADRKLYGKHAPHLMKTDVKEHDDKYEVDIDLPGFKKDEITLELKDGVLTVSAAKSLKEDETDKKGKLIRQERYAGNLTRSFYVGENLTEDEITAKFEDGVLRLTVPKKDAPKVPEKKIIRID